MRIRTIKGKKDLKVDALELVNRAICRKIWQAISEATIRQIRVSSVKARVIFAKGRPTTEVPRAMVRFTVVGRRLD